MVKAYPHRRELVSWILFIFVICALVIWVRTATVRETYAYVQKEKRLNELQSESQNLRVKWVKQTASKKLEAIAPGLGLRPPEMAQRWRYSKSKLENTGTEKR